MSDEHPDPRFGDGEARNDSGEPGFADGEVRNDSGDPGSADGEARNDGGDLGFEERSAAGPSPPPPSRAPLWPVIVGLLLVTGVGLGMVLNLSRSAAVTLFGGSGDEESSLNWAGYVAVHGHFTSVSASWVVPAVRAGSTPGSAASFWVGLDGRGTRSLQQIGTTSGLTRGGRYYSAWWEILPGPAVDVPLRIAPGDLMSASVTSDGRGGFTLSLRDRTAGESFSVRRTDRTAPLSSAEVVVEAPASATGQLPLADFGAVRFSDARVNGRPLGSFTWSRVDMTDASHLQASPTALAAGGSAFAVVRQRH